MNNIALKSNTLNQKKLFFLFFVILSGYQFANFNVIPILITKSLSIIGVLLIFFSCFKQITTNKNRTMPYKLMQWYLIFYILSSISCWIYHGQSIVHTFLAEYQFLYISFFFLLIKYKLNVSFVEKLFTRIGQIHILLFIIALSIAPMVLFSYSDSELDDSRGAYRVGVQFGWDCFILYYFYILNKWKKMKSFIYFAIIIVLFLIIVYHLTRTTIISIGVITLLFFIFRLRSYYRFIPLFLLLFFGFFGNVLMNNKVFQGLTSESKQQIINNNQTEDIRVFEYYYFFNDYNDSLGTSIFGNGTPHSESNYGRYVQNIRDYLHVYESDAGWAGVYVTFGILGLIFTIFWFVYVLKLKIPDDFFYVKMIICYYIIGNISAIPSVAHVFSISISMYILHCLLTKKYITNVHTK